MQSQITTVNCLLNLGLEREKKSGTRYRNIPDTNMYFPEGEDYSEGANASELDCDSISTWGDFDSGESTDTSTISNCSISSSNISNSVGCISSLSRKRKSCRDSTIEDDEEDRSTCVHNATETPDVFDGCNATKTLDVFDGCNATETLDVFDGCNATETLDVFDGGEGTDSDDELFDLLGRK